MPLVLNVPTFSILAPTLLDFGTEEQKRAHIPKIISGEEMWVQFLSEPSGGSDLASLVTRATRDGDVFILNGSKIWSSGAFRADYALCLARTEWHVPKHRGLTCFIVKIHQPGIEVQQIKMVNGSSEFCQEFFDDVAIPAENVVGEVNDGWTVATRLLYHERDAVGGGSPYTSGVFGGRGEHGSGRTDLIDLARATGRTGDSHVRQLVAESRANDLVGAQLISRVTKGISTGKFPGPAGSLHRLYAATSSPAPAPAPGRRAIWPGRRASSSCRARAGASGAAATRCSATSSANGSSGCHASTPRTRTSPSTRCAIMRPRRGRGRARRGSA
jgi:alkylation response protein AidB-like acyl-CoA dehydrogenase